MQIFRYNIVSSTFKSSVPMYCFTKYIRNKHITCFFNKENIPLWSYTVDKDSGNSLINSRASLIKWWGICNLKRVVIICCLNWWLDIDIRYISFKIVQRGGLTVMSKYSTKVAETNQHRILTNLQWFAVSTNHPLLFWQCTVFQHCILVYHLICLFISYFITHSSSLAILFKQLSHFFINVWLFCILRSQA